MKTIDKLFEGLDLPAACRELQTWRNTGVLADGLLRNLVIRLQEEGYPSAYSLNIVERQVLFMAMRAYLDLEGK